MTFASPAVAHFVAWLFSSVYVCGSLGFVLALVSIARVDRDSPWLRVTQWTLVTLIATWFVFTGAIAVFADDGIPCTCDACANVDMYSLLWYFLGCWAN